ncbi:hypothetical protein MPSEU_000750600 [Mayamaea pseudoterrestris]|nr:hypothetical protein MPSEU_000750600 [Mayamaea pseudoterrestris]
MKRLGLAMSLYTLSIRSFRSCHAFQYTKSRSQGKAWASIFHSSPQPSQHHYRLYSTIQLESDWSQGLFPNLEPLEGDPTAFRVAILGDLHIDPRKMDDYETARQQLLPILNEAKSKHGNVALVSLGDLGESKNCEHNPAMPTELFAGTTLCHEIAAGYLNSFGVPYEVIGGNHDLEGIDEFVTDADNCRVFMEKHKKPTPQFVREVAEKTLLVGLCSTVFRGAPYTSHEVIIDDAQLEWFEQFLIDHPADDGWKVFMFTHAPPNGSGLRVLQENHVVNGCCWLNHSDDKKCRKFIELVRTHRCIKAWFSGHFHLGQDYQDSISFPTIPREQGPYPNRGSCTFVQTSVIRKGTSRDGRQQSRLLRGNKDGFEICTIDHQKGGSVRLDATITYKDSGHEVGIYAHDDQAYEHDDYFKVYQPQAGDEGYVCEAETQDLCLITDEVVTMETRKWWRLASGRVLGVLKGMLLEYDSSTLAPLGLVVPAKDLLGKVLVMVDSGPEECFINFDAIDADPNSMDECEGFEEREQSLFYHDPNGGRITVIQPNEDGSFWRKIVRNKIARMKERRREKAALNYARQALNIDEAQAKQLIVSTYGPYTSTVGNAL